jgi:predicted nucleotidyltransferase
MSKWGTHADYPTSSLASAEAALLTAWRSLDRYQDDLVLVGGLAVHYLTRREVTGLPGAVTMDVDFGVSLGASGGQVGNLKSHLAGLGFVSEGSRLVRKFHGIGLYLDFLTEKPPSVTGTCQVDEVVACIIPGVNRALESRRVVKVRGQDLYGVEQSCEVAVADIGPLLVLKLNAFGGPTGRRHPKDAHDVLLAVTGFVDGPEAAVAAFHAEAKSGNPAYEAALATLHRDFSEPNHDGPARAAAFHGDEMDRERVKQQVVTVGTLLLRSS